MYPTDWSPDGRTILFHMLDPATETRHLAVGCRHSHRRAALFRHGGRSAGSACARRVAWPTRQTQSGQLQVYVRLVDGQGLSHNVSTKGGFDPRWRADGRELFFVSPDGMMMAADISPMACRQTPASFSGLRFNRPSAPYLSDFVVTKDGRRFLVKVPTAATGFRAHHGHAELAGTAARLGRADTTNPDIATIRSDSALHRASASIPGSSGAESGSTGRQSNCSSSRRHTHVPA